jgi:hypothetical protein
MIRKMGKDQFITPRTIFAIVDLGRMTYNMDMASSEIIYRIKFRDTSIIEILAQYLSRIFGRSMKECLKRIG